MSHDMRISDCSARCSCGYSCVALDRATASLWARQHLTERGDFGSAPLPVHTDHNGLVDPSILTDDQLRAECERRGMSELQVMSDAWHRDRDLLLVERDEWKAKAEMVEARKTGALYDATLRELDEWKRRAEAAEAKSPNRFRGTARARFDVEYGGCAICGAPPDTACSLSCDDDRVADQNVRPWSESGPGIAAKKLDAIARLDTAHYVDPLDLLANDA